MTLGGWLVMLLSLAIMTGLLGWSIYRVVTTPGSEAHLHSHADIEPDDIGNDELC